MVAGIGVGVGLGVLVAAAPAPPPSFSVGGVGFDGTTTFMLLDSLASTDNAFLSFSFWFQWPTLPLPQDSAYVFDSDLLSSDANSFGLAARVSEDPRLVAGIGNTAGTSNITWGGTPTAALGTSGWHHYIFSADLSGAGAFYDALDGVGPFTTHENFTGLPGIIQMNGFSLNISGNADQFPANPIDMAELWLAPGQSLLTTGVISPGTLAKFYSGGSPVDLGSAGATPTGTAPAVYLHRSATGPASDFANNLGTGGGPFTVTGALTEVTGP